MGVSLLRETITVRKFSKHKAGPNLVLQALVKHFAHTQLLILLLLIIVVFLFDPNSHGNYKKLDGSPDGSRKKVKVDPIAMSADTGKLENRVNGMDALIYLANLTKTLLTPQMGLNLTSGSLPTLIAYSLQISTASVKYCVIKLLKT